MIMMINAEYIAAATGAHITRAREFLPMLIIAMEEYDIITPLRRNTFLALVGHVSGGLHWTREIWGPTMSQDLYEYKAEWGNTEPGDGKRFMGRGLIPISGRAAYTFAAEELDLPVVDHPELLETLRNSARSAAWYWKINGLNELAEVGQLESILLHVTGSLRGFNQFKDLYNAASCH